MAKHEAKPGEFDTSEAVNVTTTQEEAQEVGYLGAVYDDADYTVAGVTGESQWRRARHRRNSPGVQGRAEVER